ncbi:MAG: type IV pilus modification PilV family protein [Vicinamibacterales bacterium]
MSVELDRHERGFTLMETLIAAGILVTVLASLAQLVAWSVTQARDAGRRSRALTAAQDQLEKLRGLPWTLDLNGEAVSHPALAISPADSLDESVAGYTDSVDEAGQVVDGPPAIIVRRWAVMSIESGTPDAISIVVCAFRAPALGVPREGADGCVSTARVRQP